MSKSSILAAASLAVGLTTGLPALAAPLTLEQIMADPAWIGAPVRNAYWAADGGSVYYSLSRGDTSLVDLHRIDLGNGQDKVVAGAAMSGADAPGVVETGGKRTAFVRNGDLFVRDLAGRRLIQVTRGVAGIADPQFSADGRSLSYRVGSDWFVYDFAGGLSAPAAILKTEKSPDAAPTPNDLHDLQLRTFSTLKRLQEQRDARRKEAEQQAGLDPSRGPQAFYLGEDIKILATSLSPNGRWLIAVTTAKNTDKGRVGKLTRYVTESGYEEFEDERLRVGRNPPAPQALVLLDLVNHTQHPLDLDKLPGIHDDPLKAIRAENGITTTPPTTRGINLVSEDESEGESPPRTIWSRDGNALALELFAIDHKDRWIASVDFARYALVVQHRLSDAAWVGWDYNDFGWLPDGRTLWYQSEESGFVQLYSKRLDGDAKALTKGRFEVSRPTLSTDGRWFYALANQEAPYAYDVYRVPSAGGKFERVTQLRGVEDFALSADGRRLLVTHSTSYMPAQIAVAAADGSGSARELTDTRTPAYKEISWIAPEIVKVPSTHFDGVIYAKVYRAPGDAPGDAHGALHPAVIFVHGAGYLQNVHLRYPYYAQEQMFHNLLVQKGYVVIDMDYRASQGYGRDWRTAIYRQMGHPELEDLLDGKKWLVEHAGVDPKRVGIYGGSYGGFMTLMALFRAPGEFAAGAALRPVTDWTQYDGGYTGAILNDPQVDPLAYARSSPIEFAAALQDPLLICHGVIDDNVLFEDSIRLYERLIELHKDNFTISPYPLDRHHFTNADSWLDEYKRIYRLFETNLRGAGT
jgi:dipeptidyl aminopeptidase/acylaminoacyl peptidase